MQRAALLIRDGVVNREIKRVTNYERERGRVICNRKQDDD